MAEKKTIIKVGGNAWEYLFMGIAVASIATCEATTTIAETQYKTEKLRLEVSCGDALKDAGDE